MPRSRFRRKGHERSIFALKPRKPERVRILGGGVSVQLLQEQGGETRSKLTSRIEGES